MQPSFQVKNSVNHDKYIAILSKKYEQSLNIQNGSYVLLETVSEENPKEVIVKIYYDEDIKNNSIYINKDLIDTLNINLKNFQKNKVQSQVFIKPVNLVPTLSKVGIFPLETTSCNLQNVNVWVDYILPYIHEYPILPVSHNQMIRIKHSKNAGPTLKFNVMLGYDESYGLITKNTFIVYSDKIMNDHDENSFCNIMYAVVFGLLGIFLYFIWC